MQLSGKLTMYRYKPFDNLLGIAGVHGIILRECLNSAAWRIGFILWSPWNYNKRNGRSERVPKKFIRICRTTRPHTFHKSYIEQIRSETTVSSIAFVFGPSLIIVTNNIIIIMVIGIVVVIFYMRFI